MSKADNLKGKTFREKPERINRKGRPPKLITGIVKELKKAGYERASATTVVEIFEYLVNLSEDDLKKVVADKNNPLSVRIAGKAMTGPKGWEVLQDIFDRAHGKAKQVEQHEHSGRIITGFEFVEAK